MQLTAIPFIDIWKMSITNGPRLETFERHKPSSIHAAITWNTFTTVSVVCHTNCPVPPSTMNDSQNTERFASKNEKIKFGNYFV